MVKLLGLIIKFFVDFDKKYYDPRSERFFLSFGSFWTPIIIGSSYLYFVKVLGPAWMKNRQPYTLKYPIMIYNVIQVLANLHLAYKSSATYLSRNKFSDWSCLVADKSHSDYAYAVIDCMHYYYILKILDLMDTVFFVLRKRFNQISFLHVYHHFLLVQCIFFGFRYGFNGQPFIIGVLNCIVHAIMYSYYLTSSIRSDMKNSLWWKKYITQVQMIQFSLNLVHMGSAMRKDCPEPTYLLMFGFTQNLIMLLLFGDFYMKTYVKKGKTKKVKS